LVHVGSLSDEPLAAAEQFMQRWVPQVRRMGDGDVTICLPAADHRHDGWRRAMVQELARESAPRRVNAVAGGDDAAVGEAINYLDSAPGITGQILTLDAKSGERH
jgi:hypothetical protein